MTTTVSSKGQIVLPAEIRQQDGVKPGQQFEVERIDCGEYRLKRKKRRSNEGPGGMALKVPGKGLVPTARSHGDDRRHRDPHIAVTYLVDANVLSEATKPSPDRKVLDWLRSDEPELAVDPIILGEIRFGIERMPAGRRKGRFERWFFEGVENLVCLPIEAATGIRWAQLLTRLRARGSAMPFKDSLIAATALLTVSPSQPEIPAIFGKRT